MPISCASLGALSQDPYVLIDPARDDLALVGEDLLLKVVVSIGIGAKRLLMGVDGPVPAAESGLLFWDSASSRFCLELVAVVSIGCGANLLLGFADESSGGGPSFELLTVVSTGSGANLLLGFPAISAAAPDLFSGRSLELLTVVSIGSGTNRLFNFRDSSCCFGVSLELLVVVSTGSTANRRGLAKAVLSACPEALLDSDMIDLLKASGGIQAVSGSSQSACQVWTNLG